MRNIYEVAAELGIDENLVVPYGKNKAKIELSALKNVKKSGKLILVTAITPTPAGEGKTTTTIGLADGLRRLGKKVCVALREPSLGPVFGVKGGAAGGRLCSSRSYGRHQSAFYRRFSRNRRGKQPSCGYARQPYSAR